MAYHAGYLAAQLSSAHSFRSTVANIKKILKDVEFDAVVVSGVSGISMGSVIAYAMNKQLVIVRKDGEDSHSGWDIEGMPEKDFKYIIIDDLINTGKTVVNMISKVSNFSKFGYRWKGSYAGICLYNREINFFDLEQTRITIEIRDYTKNQFMAFEKMFPKA